MPQVRFVEGDSPDYFEINVQAEFAERILPTELPSVLEIIATVTQKQTIKGVLFTGISRLSLSTSELQIDFRFSTDTSSIDELRSVDPDIAPKKQAHYVFYVFASIDNKFKLKDQPFPPGFRAFINLPDMG